MSFWVFCSSSYSRADLELADICITNSLKNFPLLVLLSGYSCYAFLFSVHCSRIAWFCRKVVIHLKKSLEFQWPCLDLDVQDSLTASHVWNWFLCSIMGKNMSRKVSGSITSEKRSPRINTSPTKVMMLNLIVTLYKKLTTMRNISWSAKNHDIGDYKIFIEILSIYRNAKFWCFILFLRQYQDWQAYFTYWKTLLYYNENCFSLVRLMPETVSISVVLNQWVMTLLELNDPLTGFF